MTRRTGKFSSWQPGLMMFIVGVIVGTLLFGRWHDVTPVPTAHAQDAASSTDLASLARDVELLKAKAPDQAHTMVDVDYHYTNLWFAAAAENWPLAEFYWKETVAHMRWAVRVIPVRKDNAGQEIILPDILQAIEQSPQMQIGKMIERQDLAGFQEAYRSTLEGCYSCHKAADKPYLRPQIPDESASSIINFSPRATWPR